MANILKKLSIEGSRELFMEFAKQAIAAALPWILSAMTVPLGIFQGIPWMYIWVSTGVMFAAVTHGLLRYDEWRENRKIDGKLRFANVRVGRNIAGAGIFLGFVVENAANLPIEFSIKNLSTRIGDRVPLKTTFDVKNIVVTPKGYAWFDDHIIQIDIPQDGGVYEGFIEWVIAYGKPSDLRYEMFGKKQVTISLDKNSAIAAFSWNEAVREQ